MVLSMVGPIMIHRFDIDGALLPDLDADDEATPKEAAEQIVHALSSIDPENAAHVAHLAAYFGAKGRKLAEKTGEDFDDLPLPADWN